jgi:hypothetical protein
MASVEFLGHIFDEEGIIILFRGYRIYWNLCERRLTKKRYTSDAFELTEAARNAFYLVKDLLANYSLH